LITVNYIQIDIPAHVSELFKSKIQAIYSISVTRNLYFSHLVRNSIVDIMC